MSRGIIIPLTRLNAAVGVLRASEGHCRESKPPKKEQVDRGQSY